MNTHQELKKLLLSMNHRGYPAYKDTRGLWEFPHYVLGIDHVQGDPFASPSQLSIRMSGREALFPQEMYAQKHRRIALQDDLLRSFVREIGRESFRSAGSGKSGVISSSRAGQEILERSACRVDQRSGDVILRFQVGFPANGRSINSPELIRILFDFLPDAAERALCYRRHNPDRLRRVMHLADDQLYIRSQLAPNGWCAFVADGSILPRESGVSSRPMKDAVPFRSPDSMAVTLQLPHRGPVRGMAVRTGITLIVGGGYHGKSTLLQALQVGVYNHIEGDGRELVITDESAVKIRAEDGRCITGADISLFIHDLPSGKDTVRFYTEDASGSTSQAANVSEAMETGTRLLLIDEDTCATNFMVRDRLMQQVVSKSQEPITPFIARIRSFPEKAGISVILVAGSSGTYFYEADTVIQMDSYVPKDITKQAKLAAAEFSDGDSGIGREEELEMPSFTRKICRDPHMIGDAGRVKQKVLSEDAFLLDREEVRLQGLEQIVDREQTAALCAALKYLYFHVFDGKKNLRQAADELGDILQKRGLEELYDGKCVSCGLAMPRREEIFGCINRYRKLKVR